MLEAVCEGAWLGSSSAQVSSEDEIPFNVQSKDFVSSVHLSPQVAENVHNLDTGPTLFSSSLHAKATADEGRRPYFLDIFCGTGGVTASLKRFGVEALGIDHVIAKKKMKGPAVKLDLTLASSQQLVLDEIRSDRVDGVMLAPPCGTSSKARNIPLRNSRGRKTAGPPPLRSEAYPEGLPGLTGVNRTRVRQANKLYKFCQQVMELCVSLGKLCIVENLQNSLMWKTKWFRVHDASCLWHIVHACMYGSKRLKKTALLINFEAANLRLLCDNSHSHLPWTHTMTLDPATKKRVQVFDTASQAEYPKPFCDELQARGFSWSLEPSIGTNAAYIATNEQPKDML